MKEQVQYKIQNKKATNEEIAFAKQLDKLKIAYTFQPPSICYLKPFLGTLRKVRGNSYTPDFFFSYKGLNYFIEIKGYMRKDERLKHKLVDLELSKNKKNKFYVLNYSGSIKQNTKGFYEYHTSKRKITKNPKKTIKKEFFHSIII